MAPPRCTAKFNPFLSLDCAPARPSTPIQGKEGIKFGHLATLIRYCYLYSHTYNNIIIDGEAFFAGANFIYSDVSAARGPIQKEQF